MDAHDPNYDSEEDTTNGVIPKLSGLHREDSNVIKPKISISAYKKRVEDIITEFFVSNDFADIARSLSELDAPQYGFEFVKRLISMSMDKEDRERELVSRLLTELRKYMIYPFYFFTDSNLPVSRRPGYPLQQYDRKGTGATLRDRR